MDFRLTIGPIACTSTVMTMRCLSFVEANSTCFVLVLVIKTCCQIKKKCAIQIESVLLCKIPCDSIDFSRCGILWYWFVCVCVFIFRSMWLKTSMWSRSSILSMWPQSHSYAKQFHNLPDTRSRHFRPHFVTRCKPFSCRFQTATHCLRCFFFPSTISDVIATRCFDQLVVVFLIVSNFDGCWFSRFDRKINQFSVKFASTAKINDLCNKKEHKNRKKMEWFEIFKTNASWF